MSQLTTTVAILALVTIAHTMNKDPRYESLLEFINGTRNLTVNDQCTCGVENINVATRIIGGGEVPAGKYPWLVYLKSLYSNAPKHCVGAIINDKYILTSSDCVRGSDIQAYHSLEVTNQDGLVSSKVLKIRQYYTKLKVTHNRQKQPKGKNAKKHHHRNEYIETFDIALLELEERLTFNNTFSPICLTAKTDIGKDADLFAAGWGWQLKPSRDGSTFQPNPEERDYRSLAKVDLRIVPKDHCKKPLDYSGRKATLLDQLCVKGKKSLFSMGTKDGLCVGDEGGPLMTRIDDRVFMLGIFSQVSCLFDHQSSIVDPIKRTKKWIMANTVDAVWCKGSPLVEEANSRATFKVSSLDGY